MRREGAPGKRRVESLAQTGEAGRGASGSNVLPEGESLKGQEHGGEAGVRANMPDPTPRKTRAIGSRMDCLNPSHQRWTSTSRATACRGAVGRIGRFHFRRPKLPCRATANEAVQGGEQGTYVALSRSTRTDTGSPSGREAHGDGAVVVVRGRESRPHGRRTAGALTTKFGSQPQSTQTNP